MKDTSRLKLVTAELEDFGCRWFVDHGTLLGLVREQQLLPWDTDINLSVIECDLRHLYRRLTRRRAELDATIVWAGRNVRIVPHVKRGRVIDIGRYVASGNGMLEKRLVQKPPGEGVALRGVRKGAWSRLQALENRLRRNEKRLLGRRGRFARLGAAALATPLNISTRFRELSGVVRTSTVSESHFQELVPFAWKGMQLWVPGSPENYLEARYGPDWLIPNRKWKWYRADHTVSGVDPTQAPEVDAERLVMAAQTQEKSGNRAAAVEMYVRAAERLPDDARVNKRLGDARRRLGQRSEAAEAYRRALDVSSAAFRPSVALQLARIHIAAGQWAEAVVCLRKSLKSRPDHARAQRTLATAARCLHDWGGSFEGSLDTLESVHFRPLSELHEDKTQGDAASVPATRRDALRLARHSLEQAMELEVDKPSRWNQLGILREQDGDLPGAIAAYAEAVALAETADERWGFRSYQQWQFRLEAAHHYAGSPRVGDPLFDIDVNPVDEQTAPAQPAGMYRLDLMYHGLRIDGFVTSRAIRFVEIRLDGQLLRAVNVGGGSHFPEFRLSIRRVTLDEWPASGRLSIHADDGRELLAEGRAGAVDVTCPHGSGRLCEALVRGEVLDKKGMLKPTPEEVWAHQEELLEFYTRVRDFFDEQLGRPLLVLYGTLLGVYRDGDMIPGDDDFDVGYVTDASDPDSFREEVKQLVLFLVRSGFTVSFNRRGRLFRIHIDDAHSPHLDVQPIWFEEGRLWMHFYLSYPSSIGEFLPVQERTLRGTNVYIPRHPESFLDANYGPGWRVPDPSFAYHGNRMTSEAVAHLDRALLTPGEYRELVAQLEIDATHRPEMGRLISIGSQSLYPVENFIT